jgi:hypothetical protein
MSESKEMKTAEIIKKAFVLVTGFMLISFQSDNHRLSIRMESKRLYNGKVAIVRADMFFKYTEGSLLMHYFYPTDYLFITNSKGEVKMYFPDKNEVTSQQNQMFASDNDALYFFLSNQINDLGLKEMGYSVIATRFEEGITITDWLPPTWQIGKISKVTLAHENYLPIYTAYYNEKNKAIRKVYFSNYFMSSAAALPQRITEIEYLPNGDSIISRKIYSDIKFDLTASSEYFDFKIPYDAKSISLQKR